MDLTVFDQEEGSSSPSLAESIETRKFLGREFLAWLWFETELNEQKFRIEGGGEFEVWLEKKIVLEKLTEGGVEKDVMTGIAPSGSAEARESLRQGKWPTVAKIALRRDEQSFAATFDADSLGLSGVKIPALLKGEGDDPFYERMSLIEQLEALLEGLFATFLELRLDGKRWPVALSAMKAWAYDEPVDGARYAKARVP